MHLQGQSESMVNQENMLTKDVAKEIRMGFVRKVYGILSMQILLTVLVAAPICSWGEDWAQQNEWLIYWCCFSTIALMCVMVCCNNLMRKFPCNYFFLFLFTACEGVLIGVICASYTVQSVLVSVGVTVLIFLGMSVYACLTKKDFTGGGPYIFALFMTFTMFGFTIVIFRLCGVYFPALEMVYNFLGVLIFTFYIVFDTQRILGQWGGHKTQFQIDDYCFASLTLYLDIINLFLFILSLFGKRRE